jgi:hypothetical protein
VKQFTDYTVLDGVHLIGERTQGENIADLGGLKIAYAAAPEGARRQAREAARRKIDGFTPEQRFFISFASVWRARHPARDPSPAVEHRPPLAVRVPVQRAAVQPGRVCGRLRRAGGGPDAPPRGGPGDHLVMPVRRDERRSPAGACS